jgi:hypothetical protein
VGGDRVFFRFVDLVLHPVKDQKVMIDEVIQNVMKQHVHSIITDVSRVCINFGASVLNGCHDFFMDGDQISFRQNDIPFLGSEIFPEGGKIRSVDHQVVIPGTADISDMIVTLRFPASGSTGWCLQ